MTTRELLNARKYAARMLRAIESNLAGLPCYADQTWTAGDYVDDWEELEATLDSIRYQATELLRAAAQMKRMEKDESRKIIRKG